MDTRSERPRPAAHRPEALRRAALALRQAQALEAGDEDLAAAAACLEAAVRELGPLPMLSRPLADLLCRLRRWEAAVALCGAAVSACTDPREAATWQLRLAEAYENLGRTEEAVTALREALVGRPRELRALQALQRLHRSQHNDAALARALEGELAMRAGTEEIGLRLELAELLATKLQRGPEALVHLRRVLQLEPSDESTRSRALELAEALGAAEEQVALIDDALAQPRGPGQRARLLARQAALLTGPLARPDLALPRWREALLLDASIPGVGEGLRTALESLGDWRSLLDRLHQESRTAGPEARRAILERAARLAAEHAGPDAALPWLERMRAEAPRDPTLLERMAALHRAAGRQEALLACIEAELALDPDAEREGALRRERLALQRENRGAISPATPRANVAASPDHDGVDERIPPVPIRLPVTRPESEADAAGAAQAAEQQLVALDPEAPVFRERRLALAAELAHLYADVLDDVERALPHLRTLVDAGAGADGASGTREPPSWAEERLLTLLRAQGSHLELVERLRAKLGRRPDDPAGWLELARLREQELSSFGAAAEAYREALARGAKPAEVLPALQRTAEALGDWPEVARVLELQLAEEKSGTERARLFRTLGDVAWRQLGATTRASRAFAAALEADPRDLVSLRALQQLLASMEDWRGTLDLIESEIELLPPQESTERRRLLLRAATLAAERVGDPQRAIRALEAADALAPLDRVTRLRLADLLRRAGPRERYVEVATALCDEPGAGSDAPTQLLLAGALRALGRLDEAGRRVKRALAAAPQVAAAWQLHAEIRHAEGAPDAAAESLVRAAEHAAPGAAVAHLLRAAGWVASDDPVYAHALLERACARDAGSVAAHSARARSALGLGRREEAEEAAVRAAELALSPMERGETGALVEVALEVAASAQAAGRLRRAARLLDAIRALEPRDPAVLRAHATALRALGDWRAARRAVAALLEAAAEPQKDAELLLIDAEGLEHEAALDEAAERFAEATQADPSLDAAWAGLARAHEQAGRPLDAIRALDAWARASSSAGLTCRLRAAELALRHDSGGSAEPRLRELIRIDPACSPASQMLASHLLATDRPGDALQVATEALVRARGNPALAALERLRARCFERLGRGDDACRCLAAVLAADPDAADAARWQAAWLRARGAWPEAAAALEAFVATAQQPAPDALAEIWLELGQLRAGPLADVEGARRACREALRLRPGLRPAREALADLLSRDAAHREEAIARHRELLEATPERVESLRALTALAASTGEPQLAADGHTLCAILGEDEADGREATCLALRVAPAPALEHPVWERARRIALAARRSISRALEASEVLEPPVADDPLARFRLAAVVAEAVLAGPALVPLRDDEVGAVLTVVTALAAEREVVSGDGRLVNALAGHLGRGVRRRVREAAASSSPEEIAEIDFASWRQALRGLAHAVALDETGGDLRAALAALSEDEAAARQLVRRVVAAFGREVACRRTDDD